MPFNFRPKKTKVEVISLQPTCSSPPREKSSKPRTFFRRKERKKRASNRPKNTIFADTIRQLGAVLSFFSNGIQSFGRKTFPCCGRSTKVQRIHISPDGSEYQPCRTPSPIPTAANFPCSPYGVMDEPEILTPRLYRNTTIRISESDKRIRFLDHSQNPNKDEKCSGIEPSVSHFNLHDPEPPIPWLNTKNWKKDDDSLEPGAGLPAVSLGYPPPSPPRPSPGVQRQTMTVYKQIEQQKSRGMLANIDEDEEYEYDIDSEYESEPDTPFRSSLPVPASDKNRAEKYGHFLPVERLVRAAVVESMMEVVDMLGDEIDENNQKMAICREVVDDVIKIAQWESEETARRQLLPVPFGCHPADNEVVKVFVVFLMLADYRKKRFSRVVKDAQGEIIIER